MPIRHVAGKDQLVREPPRHAHYLKGQDYLKTLAQAEISDVVVLTGPLGFGKITAARQVCREMWHRQKGDSMYHEIECNSTGSVEEDMDTISAHYSICERKGGAKLEWQKILRYTLKDIAEKCKDLRKYFVVDTCQLRSVSVEEVLEALDHFCESLHLNQQREADSEQHMKLLTIFVITTERGLASKFRSIGERNFICFGGLGVDKTTELICQEEDFAGMKKSDAARYAERIHDGMKIVSPLEIKVFASSLTSTEDFFEQDLTKEHHSRSGEHDEESSKFLKENIEFCFEEFDDQKKKFLVMLSLVDSSEVLSGPLVGFMETLYPNSNFSQARVKVGEWMKALVKRHLCDKKGLPGTPVSYMVNRSVQRLISKFLDDFGNKKQIEILRDTLLSLIRQKPKSGPERNAKIGETFIRHGDRLCRKTDQLLSELKGDCDQSMLSLIKILQCELYLIMGECYIAQQNVLEGVRHYYRALAKYNEVVNWGSSPPEYVVTTKWAMKLYEAGKRASFIESDPFKEYIKSLPRFYVFTEVAQYHLTGIDKQDIVNGHLTAVAYERLLQQGRVLHKEKEFDVKNMAKLYMAELQMKILLGWAKVHHHVNGGCTAQLGSSYSAETSNLVREFKLSEGKLNPQYYEKLSEIVVELGQSVQKDHGVYLLHWMIAGRFMLRYRQQSLSKSSEADDVLNNWVGVSGVGDRPVQAQHQQNAADGETNGQTANRSNAPLGKTDIFENGIVICCLEKDKYHELCCKMGSLLAFGLKTTLPGRDENAEVNSEDEKKNRIDAIMLLLNEGFKGLPPSLYHTLSCRVHRVLAQFYSCMKDHTNIARNIIMAVHHLRLSLPKEKLCLRSVLLSHVVQDLETYQQQQRLRLEEIKIEDGEEVGLLREALGNIKNLDEDQKGSHPSVQKLINQLWKLVPATFKATMETSSDHPQQLDDPDPQLATGVPGW